MDDSKLKDALPWLLGGAVFAGVSIVAVASLRAMQRYEQQGGLGALSGDDARNREGLTFKEWAYAAGWGEAVRAGLTGEGYEEPELAWQAGEDPSDHRAEAAEGAKSLKRFLNNGSRLNSLSRRRYG